MTLPSSTEKQHTANNNKTTSKTEEKVLCPHCLRTATNGIKCKGIWVADNDY